jgi:sugar lactone lactonase YvrE
MRAGETTTLLSDGHAFLEGPRWHDGRLWASDFFDHRVLVWDGDGPPSIVAEVPGRPSGLGWMPDGTLLVVSMVDRQILRVGAGGALTLHADLAPYAPWECNDMVVDAAGRAYVGNFGMEMAPNPPIRPSTLVRADPVGSAVVVAHDVICPNGMVVTPDGGTLLLAETFAGRITAFDIAEDGSLENRRIWAGFMDDPDHPPTTMAEVLATEAILPDGIALDADGALWIGDARGNGAVRVAEGGAILDEVTTDDHTAFAAMLGGDDGRTLFLCTNIPFGRGGERVWASEHRGTMRSVRVDSPHAGRP